MQKRKMRKGEKVLLIVLGSIVGLCLLVAIAGLLFLSLWPSVGKMPGKKEQEAYAKKSELYYDKKFHNEIDFTVMTGKQDTTSDRKVPKEQLKAVNPTYAEHGQTIDFAEISVSTEHWWEDNRRTMEGKTLKLRIGETEVSVEWEDNESVKALQELVADKPLTISMSMYGGFEQVGSLGTTLPRQDKKITTEAGDIVLYSGNQIVMFYGSNSWSYTKLGKVTGKSKDEMTEHLGNGNVSITISVE